MNRRRLTVENGMEIAPDRGKCGGDLRGGTLSKASASRNQPSHLRRGRGGGRRSLSGRGQGAGGGGVAHRGGEIRTLVQRMGQGAVEAVAGRYAVDGLHLEGGHEPFRRGAAV